MFIDHNEIFEAELFMVVSVFIVIDVEVAVVFYVKVLVLAFVF
jgi:hypothetical protein